MGMYQFGRELLSSRDLDPVYVLLYEANLELSIRLKWLLSYFCFYHMGTASWIVDQKDYWNAMETAAGSSDYPRCHERRHFRGENARKSIAYLKGRGIEDLFNPLFILGGRMTLEECMKYVQRWVGFGPWIAFKVADMLERLGLCRISFDNAALSLFDSPKEGAELAWKRYGKGDPPESVEVWAVESIIRAFTQPLTSRNGLTQSRSQIANGESPTWIYGYAPPRYERPINGQEAETILCKWHSHNNGRYHIGEDVKACRSGLSRFGKSPTSQRLLRAGKEVELW